MKAKTIQICWHANSAGANDPMMSLSLHPTSWVLATAGSDKEIKLWVISPDGETVEYKTNLTAHLQTVNAVRFSPNGQLLASAGDDRMILVWKPKGDAAWDGVQQEQELSRSVLRGHVADVFDVAWSANSLHLISGSVDHSVVLWDVPTSQILQVFQEHAQFVQGVSYDPLGEYIASESNDRTVRVWSRVQISKSGQRKLRNKFGSGEVLKNLTSAVASVGAASIPAPPSAPAAATSATPSTTATPASAPTPAPSDGAAADGLGPVQATTPAVRLFVDDRRAPSFFRRLSWSIDGSLLLAPTGHLRAADGTDKLVTFVIHRGDRTKPIAAIPAGETASVVVAFSPTYYRRPATCTPAPWLEAPYFMVFAVASLDAVTVYNTLSMTPIAHLANMHYERVTDLAWSADGRVLLMSSLDGYCSTVVFEEAELGVVMPPADLPAHLRAATAAAMAAADKAEDAEDQKSVSSGPSISERDDGYMTPSELDGDEAGAAGSPQAMPTRSPGRTKSTPVKKQSPAKQSPAKQSPVKRALPAPAATAPAAAGGTAAAAGATPTAAAATEPAAAEQPKKRRIAPLFVGPA